MFGMFVYFIAFLLGRSKNSTLAHAWYKANREILENNFSIVGQYYSFHLLFFTLTYHNSAGLCLGLLSLMPE